MVVLSLRCRTWAFSTCGKWGLLFVVASCCRSQAPGTQVSALAARGLRSCGLQALERGLYLWHVGAAAPHMWSLPRPGITPIPCIGNRFLSNIPPGKSKTTVLITIMEVWMNHTMNSGSSPRVGIMNYFREEQNQQIRGSSLLLNATAEKTSIHKGLCQPFWVSLLSDCMSAVLRGRST